eukprot:scaffold203736_cov41-Prasinocladus_malaysianus.AAC.2
MRQNISCQGKTHAAISKAAYLTPADHEQSTDQEICLEAVPDFVSETRFASLQTATVGSAWRDKMRGVKRQIDALDIPYDYGMGFDNTEHGQADAMVPLTPLSAL